MSLGDECKKGDITLFAVIHVQFMSVADLGESSRPPLFWVKKIAEGRKAGRASNPSLSSKSGSTTVDIPQTTETAYLTNHILIQPRSQGTLSTSRSRESTLGRRLILI